jgi:hypothetical protein
MTFNKLFHLALVSVLLICASATLPAQEQTAKQKHPITYCEVANHFPRFEHRVFRIRGIYRSGGENMSFYDPSCPAAKLTAWVDYAPEFHQKSPAALISTMEKLLNEDGRAQMDVLVKFDGPKRVIVPAGTPSEVADAMRGTNSRFGHANQFRFRVLFLKALSVEPVTKTAPWPQ